MNIKSRTSLIAIGIFLMLTIGCSSSHQTVTASKNPAADTAGNAITQAQTDGLKAGREKCLADGGRVVTESYPDGTSAELCLIQTLHTFDDGSQQMSRRCLLENYAGDTCEAGAQDDALAPFPTLLPAAAACNAVNACFHEKVCDIMLKVKNTGYAHNKNDNFSLVPDYKDINRPQTEYDLFLDCSGFVGYYVIQGLASKLYKDATPSQYACQERPLAADFADLIAGAPEVSDKYPAATKDDLDGGNVCWGQVKSIKDVQPGDVIVYKHPENIDTSKKKCEKENDRKVYKVSGNTGHILFAHSPAVESKRCKENSFSCGVKQYLLPGPWQWVVRVADSTTSGHTADSRHKGIGKSDYAGKNTYTAWEKGTTAGCVVERCEDGNYHRSCISKGSKAVDFIEIDTVHETNPTGIGVGIMYVGPDLKSYRSSYVTDTYAYKNKDNEKQQVVFIGRPVKCKQE